MRTKKTRVKPNKGLSRQAAFAEVAELIKGARNTTISMVNSALVDLYWQIGRTISRRIANDGWGKGTVTALSAYIRSHQPGQRGFSAQNLWRMRQFYEAYGDRWH